MPASPLRWGLRAVGTLVGGAALVFLPVFDWMAAVKIAHALPMPTRVEGEATTGVDVGRRLVILVSIDGLAPDVLAEAPSPTLDRLAAEGYASANARTVVPSITLTAHTSMLSGVGPEIHGVRFNRYQPWSRIAVPTLYESCRSEGLRCGMMAGKRKFVHFAELTPGVERYAYGPSASEVLRHALDYVKEAQPDFILAHLAEVDLAGHDAGWGSALQRERISEVDSLLGAFVSELRELTDRPLNLIVTADHGGSGTTHGTGADADVRIPWIVWGDALEPIGIDGAVGVADAAPTVLSLLGVEIPPDWTGVARARPLRSGS